MCTMLEMMERMEAIDYTYACDTAFNINAENAVNLNREQLNKGQKADGSKLPYYRPSTYARKIKDGQQASPMNLKDTGDFWQSIGATSDNGKQYFAATDYKAPFLQKRYNALGLNSESILKFKPYLIDTLKSIISNNLQI